MDINDMTIGQAKELAKMFSNTNSEPVKHPMLGKRCIVRTYSAGVHIGDVVWINPNNAMECKLENSLRLWSWSDGGLSLSAIANKGVVKARIDRTNDVMLFEVKAKTGRLTESQKLFIDSARRYGVDVHVVRSVAEVERLVA